MSIVYSPGQLLLRDTADLKLCQELVEVQLFINVELLEIKVGSPKRVRASVQKCFRAAQQRRAGKGKSRVRKQKASYARWPLAASAINTTNHCLFTSVTIEKDNNMPGYS